MVTKQQAMTETEFHYGECKRTVGPRGGETVKIERWRANGACKTWKREPERFQLPIKFGMRRYSYIYEYNAEYFHAAKDCPLDRPVSKTHDNGVVEVFNYDQYIAPFMQARQQTMDDSLHRPVVATCGTCERSWDDAISSDCTPTPSARCPFEYDHEYND